MGGGGLVHCGQLIFSKVQEARADSMKLAVNDWCWFPSITVTGVCVCVEGVSCQVHCNLSNFITADILGGRK